MTQGFMRTAKTLDQSPGWSESSLGAQVILLVLTCGGSDVTKRKFILLKTRKKCTALLNFWPQCANQLYANRNLRYSKWWPSFLLCCFWRVFCVYEDLILLWFCLLDSIFKQHYYLSQFIWSEVLCFSISCLNYQTWREFRRITCVLVTWH